MIHAQAQTRAGGFMAQIAKLCDLRSTEIMADPGGVALFRFGMDSAGDISQQGSGVSGAGDRDGSKM